MTDGSGGGVGAGQRAAARWAGAILLAAMAASMAAELVLLAGVASTDGGEMVRNVLAREAAYRAGAAIHMLTFASDAAVAAAFYILLSPVNRGLSLLGMLLRMMDAALLTLATAIPFVILRLAEGGGSLDALAPAEVSALARLLYGLQSDIMRVGWVCLGLGSAAFALVLLKSRYAPRALALWGVVASLALAAGPVVNMILPGTVPMAAYMGPMFFYEVPLGLWLVLRGVRPPRA
ncbi:MAG: DUF4386 domain-containing protein [Pseudomonadota bacterium]